MNLSKTFQHVFTVNYIFDFSGMTIIQSDRLYMIVGFLMVFLAAVFQTIAIYSKNPIKKMFWHRLSSPLGVGGILEVLWYVARYENIKLFGSHFVAWLIGIIVLVWIYFPIRYFFSRYKHDKQNWEKQQIKLKYLK